jgi:Arc/MetJ family transcription regulator
LSIFRIDLDDEALGEAMRLMGTTTKKDTVNAALRDYVVRARRVQAAQRLFERGRRGDFDDAAQAYAAVRSARKSARDS